MKHLLSAQDLSLPEALSLLDSALEFSAVADRQVPKLPTLRGVTMVNLFFEDSTRTRLSFEAAATRLSADVMTFQAQGSSVSKGESLRDTAQTVEAMGADIIVVRHFAEGAAAELAHSGWVRARIINAGDGMGQHPTQALLDAATLRSHHYEQPRGKDLTGFHIVIVGDIAHSRVARSNVALLSTLGAEITLVAPTDFLPPEIGTWPVTVMTNFDDAIGLGPDAVMMLRVQKERMDSSHLVGLEKYVQDFRLTSERANALPDNSIVLHPGPLNREVEIASEVADSTRSVILDQVRNGVSVRMAALYEVWGDHS
jgi:aspartate carbamoyltransferase catalytic subunit